jgi:hypothetical protein
MFYRTLGSFGVRNKTKYIASVRDFSVRLLGRTHWAPKFPGSKFKKPLRRNLMRYLAAICVMLASLSGAAAIPLSGARVQGVQVDADKNTATIHLVNGSSKDISAYVVSVKVKCVSGRTNYSELLVDLLPLMMTKLEQSQASSMSEGAFHAGEARDEVANLAADPSDPATKADAEVIAMVYSDRTAEAQSAEALERVLALRRGIALARQEATEIINKAVGNPGETHPSAVAAEGIRQLALRSKTEHTGELQTEFLVILDDLQRAPSDSLQSGVNERDYLTRYVARATQRASTALAHSQIRREP